MMEDFKYYAKDRGFYVIGSYWKFLNQIKVSLELSFRKFYLVNTWEQLLFIFGK